MKARRRKRTKQTSERSKYRFSKMKTYYSELTGLTYHYEGKNNGGVFQFLTTGGERSGMFSGYERDMDRLQLKEKNK